MKAGYKQTEVGIIPDDWRVIKLGNVCSFENGDRSSNYPSPSSFVESGIPFINAGHVADGKIETAAMDYITADSYRRLGGGKVISGDILFCLRGSLGKFGVVSKSFGEGAIASSLIIVRPKSTSLTRDFLTCYFSSPLCRRMIDTWAGGAAQPNLGAQDLARFLVAQPPTTSEQHAIAEALSDADALIESLEQLVIKKRQIKQGTMQELLTGKKRLPGFERKHGYKRTEVGLIPEDWGLEFIENLAQITTGSRNTQDRVVDGQYPFFVRSQIVERINSYSFDGEAVLTAGDGVGTGKVFHYINGRFDAHQRVYRISQFSERINGYFFYLYFSSHFYGRIMQMTAKSSVDSVRREMIARMLVPLPPTNTEQETIAAILFDMDAEIAALEAQLAKARQLKQGMMQELLTGRIRLV